MTDWAIVVPFSKPKMLGTTLKNILRQHEAGNSVALILVENGPAVGAYEGQRFPMSGRKPEAPPFPVHVFESATHQSSARNLGIRRAKALGFDAIACFDCDDYYSPEYLTEQAAYLQPGRLVGKRMHYVCDENGLWLINAGLEPGTCSDITGACDCFLADDAGKIEFPIMPVGEDTLFAYAWEAEVGEVFATSQYNYCYVRGHQNTWQVDLRSKLLRQGFKIENLAGYLDTDLIRERTT